MFFHTRQSTKIFDSSKTLSPENLQLLKDSIRFSPSSLNLQPWKVFCLERSTLREQLSTFAPGNFSQVVESSHLFVFTVEKELSEKELTKRISLTIEKNSLPKEKALAYEQFIKKMIPSSWEPFAKKQVYIALGFLMSTCALLNIAHCPLEGFMPLEFDKILGEPDYTSTVLCAVGYEKEKTPYVKTRLEEKDVFFHQES